MYHPVPIWSHPDTQGRRGILPYAIELTGQWVGFYTHHDTERPMTAEFAHQGNRLIGFMSDRCTTFEGTVTDQMLEQKMPPGADERIVARIRSMCPGMERFPVRTLVELPRLSIVEGEIDRDHIRFLKTYQGEFFAGYRVGDRRVGVRGMDQEVLYQGSLNETATEIVGHWRLEGIRQAGSFSHRSSGGFTLRKVDDFSPSQR